MTIAKISELRMNQMPDPPYSPDNAPSDFFLFRDLTNKPQGCSHDSSLELFSAITDVTGNLEKSFLRRVFDDWIACLHFVVETGGE
jgi:hypothetical protein